MTTANELVFPVSQATGEAVEAEAVVSPVTFSARYDLDRTTGLISRTDHPLRGQSVSGRIFVAPGVQGGVAAGWAFLSMRGLGVGPSGLVFGAVNPVMVQGAVTAGLPIVAGVDPAFFREVESGDTVRVDPGQRCVVIVRRRAEAAAGDTTTESR
ncbi:aconitase X swivel domain-containing protein [Streptomyces sp. NPDC050560]|uniref:aconitase X swivel domain-containing protein n=1 Tax=Streptomyces sp. NPDC050560 TaxID=3365630 RepID=UPI00379CDEA5